MFLLPFAFILHLAFGVWMYGDVTNLQSGPVDLGEPQWTQFYENLVFGHSSTTDKLQITAKLLRQNTLPLIVVLVVYVICIR